MYYSLNKESVGGQIQFTGSNYESLMLILSSFIHTLKQIATKCRIDELLPIITSNLIWPEGVVLFFNTVENKSSEWGVMPWHWYFTVAIPKALHVNIIFIIIGLICPLSRINKDIVDNRINGKLLYYVFPIIMFICLYSNLPHKV